MCGHEIWVCEGCSHPCLETYNGETCDCTEAGCDCRCSAWMPRPAEEVKEY